MLNFIKSFLQIKKIIALILTIIFSILSLKKLVNAEQFLTVFSMIIGYYFGASSTRQVLLQNNKKEE